MKMLYHHNTIILCSTKKITLANVAYFMKLSYHKSFQDPALSATSVAPTSQVCSSAMLLLLIIGNLKLQDWSGFQWCNINIKFHSDPSTGSEFKNWRYKQHSWCHSPKSSSYKRKV